MAREPVCNRGSMPRSYLLRHAKSSWKDRSLSDRDRPLVGRGRRAARAMAVHMEAEGIRPDLVLCSPARRTREALECLGTALGHGVEARFDEELYGAGEAELFGLLRALGDEVQSVVVVGHNRGTSRKILQAKTRTRSFAGLFEAAEGIRTLDLLHGKQNLSFRSARISPANGRVLVCGCLAPIPRLSTRVHGGLGSEWVVTNRDSGRPHRPEAMLLR
jgi:phosphohistidine phosphatase SixA